MIKVSVDHPGVQGGKSAMNRTAELLYLRDVRDLELTLNEIRRQKEQERKRSARLQKRLEDPDIDDPTPPPPNLRQKANWIVITAFVLFLAVEGALFLRDLMLHRPPRYSLIFFLVIGLFLFLVWTVITYLDEDTSPHSKRRSRREDLQNFVLEPLNGETTRGDIEREVKRCQSRLRDLDRDTETAKRILGGYYNMGLLPQEYQNLASVYYLYEYLTLLIQPLSEVLSDPTLDERILKTQGKLETVIRTQDFEWKQRRRKEISAPEGVEQTEAMLMQISRTAYDVTEATQYAQLSVYYSAAFAFFSKAPYLLVSEQKSTVP